MRENESVNNTKAMKEFCRRVSLGVFGRKQAVRLTISSQAAISASIIAIFASAQELTFLVGAIFLDAGPAPKLLQPRAESSEITATMATKGECIVSYAL